jgi:glutamate carboxypeptidase
MTEAGLPSLDGAGVIGDYLHSNREYCVVSSLAQRAQLTALFLHRLAAGEIVLPAKR